MPFGTYGDRQAQRFDRDTNHLYARSQSLQAPNDYDRNASNQPAHDRHLTPRERQLSTPQPTSLTWIAQRPSPLPTNADHEQSYGMNSTKPPKRRSSRSPEGSAIHQRKFSRSVQPTRPDRNGHDISNGNSNHINPAADPRNPKRGAAASFRSPGSTDGSNYQDAASSRSTPQPPPQMPQFQRKGPQTAIMTVLKNGHVESSAAAEDAIQQWEAMVVTAASLRVSHELATKNLLQAQEKYSVQKDNFKKFPSIEEFITNELESAKKKVNEIEQQLEGMSATQANSSKSLLEAIRDMIKSEATPQGSEDNSDTVSREEHDLLKSDHTTLQQAFDQQKESIEELCRTMKDLKSRMAISEKLANDAKITSQDARTTAKASDGKLADAQKALQQQIDPLASDIPKLKADVSANIINVTHLGMKLKDTDEALDGKITKVDEKITKVDEKITKIDEEITKVDKKITKTDGKIASFDSELYQIRVDTSEAGKPTAVQRLKTHDRLIDNLTTKLDAAEKLESTRFAQYQKTVDDLQKNIQELKIGPKHTTRDASASPISETPAGLTTEIETTLQTKISELKASLEENAEGLDTILANKIDETKTTTGFIRIDLDELHDRVGRLDARYAKQHVQTTKKCDDLSNEINDNRSKVDGCATKEEYTSLSANVEILDRKLTDQHTQTSGACTQLLEEIEKLKKDFTSLSDAAKQLQSHPSPAPAAAAHTARSASVAESTQFRPLPQQSPSLQGHPQTNGVRSQSPASPYVVSNGVGPGGASPNVNIAQLQQQIAGLSGFVGHLSTRFDNLTTEELHRGMVDQMSKVYPNLKDSQAAISGLSRSVHTLDQLVSTLRQDIRNIEGNVGNVSEADLTGTNELVQTLQQRISEMEATVNRIPETIDGAKLEVETAVDIQNGHMKATREKVDALEEKLEESEQQQNDMIKDMKLEIMVIREGLEEHRKRIQEDEGGNDDDER